MNKVRALNLSNLVNATHATFMRFVLEAIEKFLEKDERFAEFIQAFRLAFAEEQNISISYHRKLLSEEIAADEERRDVAFRALRNYLLVFLLSDEKEKLEAAKILLDVIDFSGGASIIAKPWDSESAILTKLVDDFQTEFAPQCETVGVVEFVNRLAAANQAFIESMAKRTLEDSEFGRRALYNARQDTDAKYRAMINVVNSYVTIGRGAQFDEFINYMNTEIDRYRIQNL